jgi:hypothetical protein
MFLLSAQPCVLLSNSNYHAMSHGNAIDRLVLPSSDYAQHCSAHKNTHKDWTVVVYIAADNDLKGFAARNIKQMAAIGSNAHINIVVQLDIRITGNQKITRRYYIEQNKIFYMNADDPYSQKMDSGDPQSLISCCKWAFENFPARQYALILWNHGTGPLDPVGGRIINPSELFVFNPALNKLELDRSIGFLDFMNTLDAMQRGILWDDSTGNYLTNQKLEFALQAISTQLLGGRKLAILGFDACLMSMIEIANIAKKYANYLVGSQEVELGTGLNYEEALLPFLRNSLSPTAFAENIVYSYEKTYSKITDDFTHSAINLEHTDALEGHINTVATLLIECLKRQNENSVKNAIKASRNRLLCTHFDEPSYVDLHHVFSNIQGNIKLFTFKATHDAEALKSALNDALTAAMQTIKRMVFANAAGKNLRFAQGVSIYFPENRMHPSYKKTNFAQTNNWFNFLNYFLQP